MAGGEFHFEVGGALAGVTAPDGGDIPPFIRAGVLRDVAERVLDHIVNQWPVDTGTSLAGFRVRETPEGWAVDNPVDYVAFVDDGLAQRLAEEGLAASASFARDQVRNILARRALPAGSRQARAVVPRQERQAVARALTASGAPPDAVALLEAGETQAAIRAYARAVEVANAVRVAEGLQLPPGVVALVRRGAVKRAVAELARMGRLREAEVLRRAA